MSRFSKVDADPEDEFYRLVSMALAVTGFILFAFVVVKDAVSVWRYLFG